MTNRWQHTQILTIHIEVTLDGNMASLKEASDNFACEAPRINLSRIEADVRKQVQEMIGPDVTVHDIFVDTDGYERWSEFLK